MLNNLMQTLVSHMYPLCHTIDACTWSVQCMTTDLLAFMFAISVVKQYIWFTTIQLEMHQIINELTTGWMTSLSNSPMLMNTLRSCVVWCMQMHVSTFLLPPVCVEQTGQLLFLMAAPDNAASVSVWLFTQSKEQTTALIWGATAPYGIASLEG